MSWWKAWRGYGVRRGNRHKGSGALWDPDAFDAYQGTAEFMPALYPTALSTTNRSTARARTLTGACECDLRARCLRESPLRFDRTCSPAWGAMKSFA